MRAIVSILIGQVEKGTVPLIQARQNGKTFEAKVGNTSTVVSYWHDIPYRSSAGKDTFTFVCEIPAKYESKLDFFSLKKTAPKPRWR